MLHCTNYYISRFMKSLQRQGNKTPMSSWMFFVYSGVSFVISYRASPVSLDKVTNEGNMLKIDSVRYKNNASRLTPASTTRNWLNWKKIFPEARITQINSQTKQLKVGIDLSVEGNNAPGSLRDDVGSRVRESDDNYVRRGSSIISLFLVCRDAGP